MRLLTLNLNYYVDKHGAWERRRKLIADMLNEQRPDVVVLQAVAQGDDRYGGEDQAQQLAAMADGYAPHFFVAEQAQRDGLRQGNAILSRHAVEENIQRSLTRLPDLDDQNQRVVVRSTFKTATGFLEVYNAHFSWVETQSLMNVRETVDFIAQGRGPFLLAGDLNTAPDSPVFEPFRQQGMEDVWSSLRPGDDGFTFESDRPSLRIDYFWVSDALAGRLRGIQRVVPPPDSDVRFSDHLGLMLDLDA